MKLLFQWVLYVFYCAAVKNFRTHQIAQHHQPHALFLQCVCLVTIAYITSFSPVVYAINRDQLWLPREYYRHFRKLYSAAEMSEATEKCKQVVAGTLSQERSTKQHPIFVVTCRDKQRKTFAYIVDGLTLDILNKPKALDPEAAAQEALRKRLANQWDSCFQQIKQRTKSLSGITGLKSSVPDASVDENDNPRFETGFNASSKQGLALQFEVICQYENQSQKKVWINRRFAPKLDPSEAEIKKPSSAIQ